MTLRIKITLYLAVLVFIGLIFANRTEAYTLSPSAGDLEVGQSYNVIVYAAPGDPGNDTSAEVQLITDNSNITITGATPSAAGTLAAGVCSPSGTYLADSVCFIYGDDTGITTGEVLGTFTIQANTVGTTTLTINTVDPSYEPSSTVISGDVATFNIINPTSGGGTSGGGTLPNTSITSSSLLDAILLLVGVVSITGGAIAYFIIPKIKYEYTDPRSVSTKYEFDVLKRKL